MMSPHVTHQDEDQGKEGVLCPRKQQLISMNGEEEEKEKRKERGEWPEAEGRERRCEGL